MPPPVSGVPTYFASEHGRCLRSCPLLLPFQPFGQAFQAPTSVLPVGFELPRVAPSPTAEFRAGDPDGQARLATRLSLFAPDHREVECGMDGACMFRSISAQVYRTPNSHWRVRKQVVDYMRAHEVTFRPFFEVVERDDGKLYMTLDDKPYPTFEHYLMHMSRPHTYGDYLCLVAAARVLRRQLILISTSIGDEGYAPLVVDCGLEAHDRLPDIWLAHYAEGLTPQGTPRAGHYTALMRVPRSMV